MRLAAITFLFAFSSLLRAESLFSAESFRPLIVDQRAYAVGDGLTILVLENSSAFTSADTDLSRTSDFGLDAYGGNASSPGRVGAGVSSAQETESGGSTARSGRLQAQISVRVIEVDSRGDLLVTGEKTIEVNRERQLFRITGRVRRADIQPDNTVLSSRLSDVKILFSGDGDISGAQKPGLLWRVFSWLGLL